MDEEKTKDFKMPLEWIERIFKRLAEVYGARFASKFTNPSYVDLEKTRWQSGLYGATADEIRHVLEMCRQGLIYEPPNVIEFFHYCKGVRQPFVKPKPPEPPKAQTELGQKYLKLIMDKLNGRLDSEGQAALSALDKQILSERNGKNPHWQDK